MRSIILDVYAFLKSRFQGLAVEKDFSLARHTTVGVGGVAAAAVYPTCIEEAAELLGVLDREKIPYAILGAGANVLPQDEDFDGAIVRFSKMNFLFSSGDFLYAGAGVTGGKLTRFARERAFGGLECFTGIPMTVGGAAVMNAGVKEGYFSSVCERVIAFSGGKLRIFSQSECGFGTKTSIFLRENIAILGASLRVFPENPEKIAQRESFFREKRKHLPKGRSMGCTFVNPTGDSAGAILDKCGLKGKRVGGAYVSELHANFILCEEGATARDVKELIALMKQTVLEKTGILLREEIRYFP